MRRLALVVPVVVGTACAVGPAPGPAPSPAPPTVGTAPASPAVRGFFDSLAARQARPGGDAAALPLPVDPAGDLAWAALFRDSTLSELVRTAVAQNRDVQAAAARLREYRAALGASRAALLPDLSLNPSASRQQVVFGTLGTFAFNAYRVTADLNWELDFWGRLRRGVQAARGDADAQRADARATQLTLVSDVALAYLDLREVDANLEVAERTLASRQQTLRLAQRRFEQGIISELDVRQFEAAVAQPAATAAELVRARAETEHRLSLLLGQAPGAIPRGRPLGEVVRQLGVPDSLPSALLARRPDVQRADAEQRAASARVGVAIGNRLPRLVLTGQYGTQSLDLAGIFADRSEIYTAQAGLAIPLPIGGGARLGQEAEAARARAEQARLRYEQVVLTALKEAADALVGVRASRDLLAAQQLQVDALRRALQLAERRYASGIASYLEVLDAQRTLFAAELARTQAERLYLASAVAVYKAVGGVVESGER